MFILKNHVNPVKPTFGKIIFNRIYRMDTIYMMILLDRWIGAGGRGSSPIGAAQNVGLIDKE
jgi:hypothetical protein